METILNGAGLILVALIIGAAISVMVAFPVMLLWNAVIPSIFGLQVINFSQALMLSLLCSILFKSSSSSSSK